MKNQTIGVEIEMTGVNRNTVAKVLAKHFGTAATYIGGSYKAYEVDDNEGRTWKVMRDSSIRAEKKNGEEVTSADDLYQVELVTPILTYNDIENLQEVVRSLRKAGAFANESCGLHVHVGGEKFTAATLRNLVNSVASKEDLIYKALKVHEGRKNYCGKANQRFLEELNEKKPENLEELKSIWYNGETHRARHHYDVSRYTILNLHSFFNKGTVEFRVFNSTLHAGKIKAYVQFCLALTHNALATKKAIYRPTETDNPKYTFRCWLLRLGLIGEEFATCRLHLLKNLEGNAAWRQATA